MNIDFDRWNETVEIAIKETGQAYKETNYSGTYEAKGNLLILTLDNGTKVVIEYEDGKYRFVEAVRESGSIVGYSKEIVFSFKDDEFLPVYKSDKSPAEVFKKAARKIAN